MEGQRGRTWSAPATTVAHALRLVGPPTEEEAYARRFWARMAGVSAGIASTRSNVISSKPSSLESTTVGKGGEGDRSDTQPPKAEEAAAEVIRPPSVEKVRPPSPTLPTSNGAALREKGDPPPLGVSVDAEDRQAVVDDLRQQVALMDSQLREERQRIGSETARFAATEEDFAETKRALAYEKDRREAAMHRAEQLQVELRHIRKFITTQWNRVLRLSDESIVESLMENCEIGRIKICQEWRLAWVALAQRFTCGTVAIDGGIRRNDRASPRQDRARNSEGGGAAWR